MQSVTSEMYRSFARVEARDISPIYCEWASSVAEDSEVLAVIETLPWGKRQPNLIFAAARLKGAPVGPYREFRAWILDHWSDVEPVVRERSTQTNEAGRCAVLLPVLSRLEGPLALIEAGASAGLCLYPDKYSYRYDTGEGIIGLDPAEGLSTVELPCRIDPKSVPHRIPEVVARVGVDVNPLDVSDPAQVEWLETLVWPEHDSRRRRLQAARKIVAADPPNLVRGDLLNVVPSLVAQAPHGSRPVVFHSAVLVYLEAERRARFVDLMQSMPEVTWISNEGEHVLPTIKTKLAGPANGRTVVSVNGTPLAFVGAHGQSYEAL
ncbi:hypothetical protein QFZ52_001263 [Arthrobacter woluwensis]|uniref:DUF2332 domain-containing protein n=1 Tax=Arthrobacter woluwensis TaxID=156980 RepID=UPI002782300F|nr:DUF2332 domain-containing protein [Arthrobacter woluwensis]MDQ0708611.1 hypothetical protein [Arthrobacter woluwensis]